MIRIVTFFFVLVVAASTAFSQSVVIKKDNGAYGGYGPASVINDGWEESVILGGTGPCRVLELYVYLAGGKTNALDTIVIAGDASEGAIPPTSWVWYFNALAPPIVVTYRKAGWDTIDVRSLNLRIEGYDHVCIQHKVKKAGPYFGYDTDQAGQPYTSFLMTPYEEAIAGVPGKYYLANGDYLVRMLVEYDYPNGSTSQPPPAPTLVDVTKAAGVTDASGNLISAVQASVVDFDNDGWDDLAIGGNLFRNKRDGTYENVTAKANISAGATIWGDLDNDGLIDCFAANGWSNDKLYKNNGDGTFTDVTAKSTIVNNYPTMSPVWVDYDNDGLLDMFIANNRSADAQGNETYYPPQLWHNQGGGVFKNVTQASHILDDDPAPYYDCYGATACDYNNDGWMDLFIATYRLAPDLLYKNNKNGTFTNVGDVTGVQGNPTLAPQYFGHGMGCEFADFNNDGLVDLVVGNLGHPDVRGLYSNPSLIFKNNGAPDYTFNEVHTEMGLKFFEMNAGVLLTDLDLDGYQDIWHGQISYVAEGSGNPKRPARIYMNQGPPDFLLKNKTWDLGSVVHGPWTAVRSDIDRDGDPDLIVSSNFEGVKIFRNDIAKKGKWLGVRLIGSPSNKIPMDAYGTKVTVYAGGKLFYRDLPCAGAGSRATQNSNDLMFGLGEVTGIDSVVVRYTNGFHRTYTNMLANHKYTIPYDASAVMGVPSPVAYTERWQLANPRQSGSAILFEIATEYPLSNAVVELYNTLGQKIMSQTYSRLESGTQQLRLPSGLASGMYFLRAADAKSFRSAKVLVIGR